MTARAHGTRARYVWGPGPGQGHGCRCEACTAANRAHSRRRNRMILYSQWEPFVDAAPVHQHLQTLRAAGIGRRRIAKLSGLSQATVCRLLYGKPGQEPPQRVRPRTAAAILAIQPQPDALAPSTPADATGTRRRLQALVTIGWSQGQLARRLGMTRSNFGGMLRRGQVTASTARAVTQLYDELWDKPPAAVTPRARAIASGARKYARDRGWAPPLAWDDHAIDDPAAAAADGWQRTAPRLAPAELAAEAAELITSQGYTRQQAADRLGVTKAALEKAFARTREAPPAPTQQEGSTMTFDPVPRSAPEHLKGAAFAHEMVMRQADAGQTADQIAERHTAAITTLTAAARSDGEREFLRGFTATGQDHIDTLRAAQHAEQAAEGWEHAAEHEPEREAG